MSRVRFSNPLGYLEGRKIEIVVSEVDSESPGRENSVEYSGFMYKSIKIAPDVYEMPVTWIFISIFIVWSAVHGLLHWLKL